MASNSIEQYIGAEVVLLYWKCDKLMGKFRKRIKNDEIITGYGHYTDIHNKSVNEVDYPDRTTE